MRLPTLRLPAATPAATVPGPPAPPRVAAPAAVLSAVVALLLSACATPLDRANALLRGGQTDAGIAALEQALREQPADATLRAALLRQRNLRAQQWLAQADAARGAGRLDDARRALDQARALDPALPRLAQGAADIDRQQRQQQRVAAAQAALAAGDVDTAEALVRALLAEDPGLPAAAELRRRIAERQPMAALAVAPALRRPVARLAFHEAPLRQVFEALSGAAGLSFVFDREVKADTKVTLTLRDSTVDEALRIVLATQALERKLLNAHTLLIYPATAAKQREHQELQTRAFYLANADVKQAQAMVRTLAKSRDIHVEERLNLLLVRDTPEALQLVERLIATIDLPDPEVVLDVEVLEVASDRIDSLGLNWPDAVSYGQLNGTAEGGVSVPTVAPLGARGIFRSWVANPVLLATLKGSSGAATLISNPSIRVRNREKAKVLVGDKLPVFTTTATANVGVSASVAYLDVGLKVEIEPSVQLGNEVSMKVALEVSNLVKEVAGPSGSLAYQVGTRNASTVLRLKDGETQVLAGLISDEDRRRAAGLPGLSALAGVGPLFGVQTDTRSKTEVVLLITPRVVRNLVLPPLDGLLLDSGVDGNPGLPPLRLGAAARGELPLAGGAASAAGAAAAGPAAVRPAAVADDAPRVRLQATDGARAGELVTVTLANASVLTARGELEFEPGQLQPASDRSSAPGRMPFELPPRGERAFAFRVLPDARGNLVNVSIATLSAQSADGKPAPLVFDREVTISVEAD